MHALRTNLDFHPHIVAVHQGRVDRLVGIALWRGNIVLETAWNHFPFLVQDAERAIAFGAVVGHHAERHDIGQLLEANVPFLHLAPDRIGMFLASADLRCQPAIGESLLDRFRDFLDLAVIPFLDRLQSFGDGLIGFGFHVPERQQLHLAHIFIHADPFC